MPKVYWLTGLPSSGKTTLAKALVEKIDGPVKHLDGDETRKGLCSDLDFSPEGRAENIRRVGWLAKSFHDQGFTVICSYVSPYKAGRQFVRQLFHKQDFVEIYLCTHASVCEKRDPKGLWKKARAGGIKGFTGIDDPYEPPEAAEWVFQTLHSPEEIAYAIMFNYMMEQAWNRPKTSLFIGRWQPLHPGHVALIRSALDVGNHVVVAIRDIPLSDDNPHTVQERVKMLTAAFPEKKDVKRIEWISIPEGPGGLEVCHGRKVGWPVRVIHLDSDTEDISGTKIREEQK